MAPSRSAMAIQFFPLIVDYRENTYAAGKIPGGFFKREGRPSEREILISRLIDRPIRPLFPDGYNFDTQIVALLLSADIENESDTLGIIGASAALYFSDIPFNSPIGAVKVGYVNDEFVINPKKSQLDNSPLNMVVVGNENGVLVIEAGCLEVSEEKIIQAVSLAQTTINEIIRAQKDLFEQLNIKKRSFEVKSIDAHKTESIEREISSSMMEAIQTQGKKESEEKIHALLDTLLDRIPEENEEEIVETKEIFYSTQKKLVRRLMLHDRKRIDGRWIIPAAIVSLRFMPRE